MIHLTGSIATTELPSVKLKGSKNAPLLFKIQLKNEAFTLRTAQVQLKINTYTPVQLIRSIYTFELLMVKVRISI